MSRAAQVQSLPPAWRNGQKPRRVIPSCSGSTAASARSELPHGRHYSLPPERPFQGEVFRSLLRRSVAPAISRAPDGRERGRRAEGRLAIGLRLEQRIGRTQAHALQLISREAVQWLPRRNAQGSLQKFNATTHLDRVLREAADVA